VERTMIIQSKRVYIDEESEAKQIEMSEDIIKGIHNYNQFE
jgi:hypothetical protein